jgi:hypothetical protein
MVSSCARCISTCKALLVYDLQWVPGPISLGDRDKQQGAWNIETGDD